ncbi:MAG: hypothetical protein JNM09_04085 [Blastocatellia bacterium]|nr:hypothetical protein [Blastocatellia bacterium]
MQKAVQEFRVQVGQIGSGAGPARMAGKQNAYTGRIYEYLRNNALDALPHEVRQRGGSKSLLQRNQFGFSLSGPVRLPKVYDGRGKTFFSVSYEGTIERIAQSYLFTLPTTGQRAGDFSDYVDTAGNPVKIYDPATTRPNPNYNATQPIAESNLQYLRDPFPNNVIPANRLDPVARALVAMYPTPNVSIGPFLQNNYAVNNPFENRANGIIAKLDHTLTERQQLSFNLNTSSGLRKSPEYFSGPANSGQPSYNFETRSVSLQNTWTKSPKAIWRFSFSAYHNLTSSLEAEQGKQDYPRQLGLTGLFSGIFPTFRFGNYLGIGPRNNSVFRESSYSYSPSVSVSLNRKAHTLRLTQSFRRNFDNVFSPFAPAGYFTFGTAITSLPGILNTGNPFASFLLGMVNQGEESIVGHPSYYRKDFVNFIASDEYRVRPGITATFSVNTEISMPRIEKFNRQSTVSLKHINPANGKPGALIFAGRNGIGRALQPTTMRAEPSIGLAMNPNRKTVVRLNYGLSYQAYSLYGRHFGTQGFNTAALFLSPNDQLEPAFTLRSGVPQNFQLPPNLTPTAANGTDADYVDASGRLPSTQQWSLSVQRELPKSLQIEINYVGWRSRNLFVDSLVRLNAVPIENLQYRDQLYNQAFRDSLRPYPQYRNLALGGVYPAGQAHGHAMNVTLDKRLSAGLYGRVSYRFAKQLDNVSSGSPQDPNNLDVEMTLSASDITHSMQASYTYELPFGKGKAWLSNDEWLSKVIGGWSVSGLTSWRGGNPLVIRPLFNRTGTLIPNLHVNVVPGVNPNVENPSPQAWFNPAAFAQPDDFTIGNASYAHPTLREPGTQFHHLSMTKRFELSGDKTLEWVAEAFNFPNHANLNDPDTRIGTPASPNLNAGKIIGSTGGRVMQLGVRILF